jgi:hypothetical protein
MKCATLDSSDVHEVVNRKMEQSLDLWTGSYQQQI